MTKVDFKTFTQPYFCNFTEIVHFFHFSGGISSLNLTKSVKLKNTGNHNQLNTFFTILVNKVPKCKVKKIKLSEIKLISNKDVKIFNDIRCDNAPNEHEKSRIW